MIHECSGYRRRHRTNAPRCLSKNGVLCGQDVVAFCRECARALLRRPPTWLREWAHQSPQEEFLREDFGDKITKYVCGRTMQRQRAHAAWEALTHVAGEYGVRTAKSWLLGRNGSLEEESPAYVLRHARSRKDLQRVVLAAKAFTAE